MDNRALEDANLALNERIANQVIINEAFSQVIYKLNGVEVLPQYEVQATSKGHAVIVSKYDMSVPGRLLDHDEMHLEWRVQISSYAAPFLVWKR